MDFGFRSDVDALRGFIQDHDAGMDRKASRQRDLLLVSARERPGGAEDRGGLDAQQVYVFPGQIALFSVIDQAPARDGAKSGETYIHRHLHLENDSVLPAIFGQISDAEANRISGRVYPARGSRHKDVRAGGRETEKCSCQRSSSRATSPMGTSRLGYTDSIERPTIRRINSSRSTSAAFLQATDCPSRSTVMRSAMARTSSRRCE